MVADSHIIEALTFDDVLIEPSISGILPSEASLKTKLTAKISLNVPLLSAAMDTVTEFQTAIAIAKEGGIGIIHKNLSISEQALQVERVKRFESGIITHPITVNPEMTLAEIKALRLVHGFSAFPVVEGQRLVGIITKRDIVFEDDESKKAKELMSKDLITVNRMVGLDEAREILRKNKVEKLPIVDSEGNLKGLITSTDVNNEKKFPNSNKDSKGRLLVGAAVGPKDDKRVEQLLEKGADVIVLDTAHGHSVSVIDAVKRFKKAFNCEIIAGNIATSKAAEDLISAGADAVKVGVGPGSICTTRIISGIGIPQVTAIMNVAKIAEKEKIPVIADGGVKYSGDITKSIAAGASSVMIGSLFAGCEETPGKIVFLNNRKFKQYRGMGSIGAMPSGSKDRYGQGDVKDTKKLVPEGIEGVVPFKGSISEMVFQLLGGLRSGMGYAGCKTIEELRKNAKFVRITGAGLKESHPHDVMITEEAPNYSQ
ncbi:MAG: IMP dehydrogenase [Candidatus Diapherotrites archaeon]|nr:IMP dehydrogenase [Candidatus Diapherotrites archaeon]